MINTSACVDELNAVEITGVTGFDVERIIAIRNLDP
jgi:hypothetical protein